MMKIVLPAKGKEVKSKHRVICRNNSGEVVLYDHYKRDYVFFQPKEFAELLTEFFAPDPVPEAPEFTVE